MADGHHHEFQVRPPGDARGQCDVCGRFHERIFDVHGREEINLHILLFVSRVNSLAQLRFSRLHLNFQFSRRRNRRSIRLK